MAAVLANGFLATPPLLLLHPATHELQPRGLRQRGREAGVERKYDVDGYENPKEIAIFYVSLPSPFRGERGDRGRERVYHFADFIISLSLV